MQNYCAGCGCPIESGSYCSKHEWIGVEQVQAGEPIPQQCDVCELYMCQCGRQWRVETSEEE
jgi:hypothetical protein